MNGLPVVLDLALRLSEDLLQLVHLALQLGLKGELHVVECEGARGQLIPSESDSIDGKGIVRLVRYQVNMRVIREETGDSNSQLTWVQHCPGLLEAGWGGG